MTITTVDRALQPPTSRLPPIKKISSSQLEDLLESLRYLRLIYNPHVRGSKRRRITREFESASHADAENWSSDPFERTYAIRWLTAMVSRCEQDDSFESEALIQEAASLLAICSGTAGAGVVRRIFNFSPCVQVQLTDIPLENQDFQSVGAQTWGGACVLAEAIVEAPQKFDFNPALADLRILELGAGTGLVSLAVAKMLQAWNTPFALVATDFYPLVLTNLQANIAANFPRSSSISSCHLDWAAFADDHEDSPLLYEPFDVILGADIIYEAQHALWIKACLRKLLRTSTNPTSDLGGVFHLIIPLRSAFAFESSTMDTVFDPRPGDVGILEKETIVCDSSPGNERESVEYAYYKIGWI